MATVVDVSERRALELQLQQSQKLEAIGRLAGGIAHDFNNVLGVIMGFGELAQRRLPADHAVQDQLEQILRATARATGLTRQLLAFSRRQVLRPRVVDLNAVIRSAQTMLGRLLGADLRLVTRLEPQLGTVLVDPTQAEQILMNLAVNARDAMSGGGTLSFETANVELDADYVRRHQAVEPGSYVMLSVSDTGAGMDETTRAHIFEPFFTTKPEGKGTGLGLATVYGIVRQSEGFIWVYSEPGQGATFKVYLPRHGSAAELEPSPPESLAVPRGWETILLVEDQPALRRTIRELIEQQGYTVLEAADGASALDLARRHSGPIHLVLTDVVMPGMSGRELADGLRGLRAGIRTLYMSGYSDGAISDRGLLADDVSLIEKPFTAASVARAVRRALEGE